MKKIYSFMVAAVAMIAAVSCNKEFSNDNLFGGDVITFRALVDGADTKAVLNGTKSSWEANDKITIINAEKGFEFSASGAGPAVNFCYNNENKDFSGDKFYAVYPASANYSADFDKNTVNAYIPTYQKANLGGYPTYSGDANMTATLAVAYTENELLKFKNACALLKFNVSNTNITHVKFYGNNEEAITGNMMVSVGKDDADETTINSVEGQKTIFTWGDGTQSDQYGTWVEMHAFNSEEDKYFEAGEDKYYYIAVAPANFTKGFAVKVTIDGEEHEINKHDGEYTLAPNTILNLGTFTYDPNKVDASAYGVVGSFQGWDVANPVAMKYVSDGWIVAENVELYKNDAFKFAKDKSWDISYGTSKVEVLEDRTEKDVVTEGSQNMQVSKNGKYNLYLNPNTKKVKVECVEEYTDLMVNITVDNKANWNPLTISLWDGDTQIVTNDAVTNNTYAISGDYIGSSLTCQLSSGSKVSEKMTAAITKNGATVTLEETVVKIIFKLVESNQQTYWGNNSYLYVWGSGSSLDKASWPGTKMTKETAAYTWSIIIPSDLVDKQINYIINNGSGWQSPNSKITIKSGENEVTDKMLGIK